ncbi:MAG TPA: beta-ketoacyl-ACP synthase III [Planctomycetota bacterium]|nr:beta-ketoacyl-ACP synthase III [Planctomycetota bacterium]
MTKIQPVGIAGVGKYVPERRLTNRDLEAMVDTSDEWIVQRTGISERRIAAADESCSTVGVRAARAALEDARLTGKDIDLVLCCTVTGDQPFPATACRIGADIGAVNAGGFDISAACSGFLYGMQVGAQFVATGAARNVLVIGAEVLSRILDYKDRNTCVLFGDGAGAVILSPLERAGRGEYLGGSIGMEGGQEDVLCVPAGGSRKPASRETIEQGQHYMKMGGVKVFRFAVKVFADLVEQSMRPYGYDQLGLVIPHQVNQRIIEAAAERVGLPTSRFFVNIDRYGNTSAASVPIALTEAVEQGRVVKDKIVCMVAFGAGMAWGHVLLRW